MRRRTILFTALAATFVAATPALTETNLGDTATSGQQAAPVRAVVELFTSQGCSSCPPADVLLQTIAKDPTVIALSLPVDYWDYLGWKDSYASPRNSERQRSYAKARGDGAIYTPQAVINGTTHVNGSSKAELESAIDAGSKSAILRTAPIRFWQERNTMNIAIGAADPAHPAREATIWLGVIQASGTVDIKRGENAGQQLTYTNIVRELTPVGLWKGQPLEIQIPRSAVMQAETQKSVVLIQEGRAGPIIGAAWAGLW